MESAGALPEPVKPRLRLPRAERPRFQSQPLPLWLRVAVNLLGWILVALGVVGLFLPVLQGGLSLALGLALLSIGSPTIHLWLRGWMGRWPRLWRRMERLRRGLHRWLHRNAGGG
jgi:hypothetical protein